MKAEYPNQLDYSGLAKSAMLPSEMVWLFGSFVPMFCRSLISLLASEVTSWSSGSRFCCVGEFGVPFFSASGNSGSRFCCVGEFGVPFFFCVGELGVPVLLRRVFSLAKQTLSELLELPNKSVNVISYLLGLLAMIKCSICSYQCDN